jgi:hypothetical protein
MRTLIGWLGFTVFLLLVAAGLGIEVDVAWALERVTWVARELSALVCELLALVPAL